MRDELPDIQLNLQSLVALPSEKLCYLIDLMEKELEERERNYWHANASARYRLQEARSINTITNEEN